MEDEGGLKGYRVTIKMSELSIVTLLSPPIVTAYSLILKCLTPKSDK